MNGGSLAVERMPKVLVIGGKFFHDLFPSGLLLTCKGGPGSSGCHSSPLCAVTTLLCALVCASLRPAVLPDAAQGVAWTCWWERLGESDRK